MQILAQPNPIQSNARTHTRTHTHAASGTPCLVLPGPASPPPRASAPPVGRAAAPRPSGRALATQCPPPRPLQQLQAPAPPHSRCSVTAHISATNYGAQEPSNPHRHKVHTLAITHEHTAGKSKQCKHCFAWSELGDAQQNGVTNDGSIHPKTLSSTPIAWHKQAAHQAAEAAP
jgi:hypothetical protein